MTKLPAEPTTPAAPPKSAAERYLDLWERHVSLTARDGRLRQSGDSDGPE